MGVSSGANRHSINKQTSLPRSALLCSARAAIHTLPFRHHSCECSEWQLAGGGRGEAGEESWQKGCRVRQRLSFLLFMLLIRLVSCLLIALRTRVVCGRVLPRRLPHPPCHCLPLLCLYMCVHLSIRCRAHNKVLAHGSHSACLMVARPVPAPAPAAAPGCHRHRLDALIL